MGGSKLYKEPNSMDIEDSYNNDWQIVLRMMSRGLIVVNGLVDHKVG